MLHDMIAYKKMITVLSYMIPWREPVCRSPLVAVVDKSNRVCHRYAAVKNLRYYALFYCSRSLQLRRVGVPGKYLGYIGLSAALYISRYIRGSGGPLRKQAGCQQQATKCSYTFHDDIFLQRKIFLSVIHKIGLHA